MGEGGRLTKGENMSVAKLRRILILKGGGGLFRILRKPLVLRGIRRADGADVFGASAPSGYKMRLTKD